MDCLETTRSLARTYCLSRKFYYEVAGEYVLQLMARIIFLQGSNGMVAKIFHTFVSFFLSSTDI